MFHKLICWMINLYDPQGGRGNNLVWELIQIFTNQQQRYFIIVGDLNAVIDPSNSVGLFFSNSF